MIACQLADLACKHRRAIGEEELRFTDPARVEEQHPRRRMTGMVFEIEPEFAFAHRNPRRLAAPAAVDYLGLERQHFADHSQRFRRTSSIPRAASPPPASR